MAKKVAAADEPQAAEPLSATATAFNDGEVFAFIQLPIAPLPGGYVSRRIDVSSLTHTQAKALARITAGLDRAFVRLENGRRVVRSSDAVRWLLEAAATALLGAEPSPPISAAPTHSEG